MGLYEILDHTADTGVEATGESLDQLIGHLAEGMFGLIADVEPCPSGHPVEVEVSAEGSDEDLVFDVLSELLYRSETDDLILCAFDVVRDRPDTVRVSATGVPWHAAEIVGPPIKAVTYHDIEVTERPDGWYGRVYFDV